MSKKEDNLVPHLKWTDPAAFECRCDNYFKEQDKAGRPYTVTGLAYHLGITRETLNKYGKKEGLGPIVSLMKTRIEAELEEELYRHKGTGGIKFNLKANFGWVDKTTVENTGTQRVINITLPDQKEDDE